MDEVKPLYPIIEKTYDLVLWLYGRTEKFPRARKQSLGLRIENHVMDLYEALMAAPKSSRRRAQLDSASQSLDKLRGSLRIALGLRLISVRQFGFVSGLMEEIGRMLGGWLKKEGGRRRTSTSPPEVASPAVGAKEGEA
ncbi:MAG: diversity-generating retroelement protein Avd [Armatimonadetes bacterium]|nr:diversity-generating retroelement protein Avd [Armatimonadota bacterium]PIU62925.1 MAG: four helix bundle protein [Armatimonadetes bacterium CG07_land_8_20_14_0_80_59_28]PIY45224.1 MAG: four helix bundle protein [Armatimonadetes bacterium CG_4_10_14_3_um_filter_59_10]PJB77037.1 MAG: four helix bundle protein [Armatimonadetes bacterium CG_4_9_14_3_um_filter_58_7]